MDNVTVLIPVSPIPSHPSSEVVDETIASIRERLPDSEIIVMFDGVSPKLMHLKAKYEQFVSEMLTKINNMDNAMPVVAEKHEHQSGLTRLALPFVDTPLILWAEQDTPLFGNIPMEELGQVVTSGYANLIRFHHEAAVHPEHEYLMLDKEPVEILGQPFLRTTQWSGRPHLASTEFYKDICAKYFPNETSFWSS